jgi:hypothetical protein
MARQNEHPLRLGSDLVVFVGSQPKRLVAVIPLTLAKEGDPLRSGLAPTAFAHDLVDPAKEQWIPLGRSGAGPAHRRSPGPCVG